MSCPRNVVLHGDCLEVMRSLPADSVDSIVTDPPYELGFMGKSWDSAGVSFSPATWAEALRVLKPGGHLLAFGGSRTYHRIAVAIEDAGFEIRDSLMWIYGSGFPKSLNVSKAIDKQVGLLPDEERFCAWIREHSGLTATEIKKHLGSDRFFTGELVFVNTGTTEEPRPGRRAMVPTAAAWAKLRPLLKTVPPDWVEALVKEPPRPGITHPGQWQSGKGQGTSGTNDWEGWGTALKPAHEPIVLARKPLIGTVAENVLAHGTGALNIDASRIGTDVVSVHNAPKGTFAGGKADRGSDTNSYRTHVGRWPANVLFDEEAAALLDAQSGHSKSSDNKWEGENNAPIYGKYAKGVRQATYSDAGGASRFFYVAKAGKKERNAGLDGFVEKRPDERTEKGMGTFDEKGVAKQSNFHPTVKPITLMRYLVRLITPPGGVVLDPFLGSGTTACAAVLEGFDYIGIEREAEYVDIARARVEHWAKQTEDEE